MYRDEKRRQQKLAKKAARATSNNTSIKQQTLDIQQSLDLAVQHHAAGRLPEAESICQHVLKANPDQTFALLLLGVISRQMGKNDLSAKVIEKALKINPEYIEAHNHLGITYSEQGRWEDAIDCYRNALIYYPDFIEAHNNLGNALKEQGCLDEAVTCFRKVLAINPDLALPLNNLGNALKEMGRLDEAVESYQKALSIQPDYFECYSNLGNALLELGQTDDAIALFNKSIAIHPNFAPAYSSIGFAFHELGRIDEAITSLNKAISIKPDFVEAHSNIIDVLEKTNSADDFRRAVAVAKKNCPNHPLISLGEAQLLKLDGDYKAARIVLEAVGEDVADTQFQVERSLLLGDLCDRLGDVESAFGYFKEGNDRSRGTSRTKRVDEALFVKQIDVLAERFTPDWIAGWRNIQGNDDGRADPVFMVGFPRSGTTLLDTILRSHHAITVVEEMPTVQNMRLALEGLPSGYPDGLLELDPAHLEKLRQVYFAELDKHLEPEERSGIVIDRMPLNIVEAGFIHRIFPQSRFVFAQRHPCDCVLSCFMQNFLPNNANVNFLDLEDAARLYDKAMTLWQHHQENLPLEVYTVRYESLVEEFEETLNPLLHFLGVEWDDGIRNYTETAKSRKKIKTASYNQVTQPLYTRARGRWERYRTQMQPVLSVLLPWARRYGYVD